MKRKLLVLNLILITLLFIGTSCSKKDSKEKFLDDFYKQYATDYNIVEENKDGTFRISITAPDVKAIVEIMSKYNGEGDVNIDDLRDTIKEYPDCKKEYIFNVNELTNDGIKVSFSNEIAKDLVISAIENIEYTETWGTEE